MPTLATSCLALSKHVCRVMRTVLYVLIANCNKPCGGLHCLEAVVDCALLDTTAHILAGSSNGRTAAFEAVNLGSNPSPAAMIFPYITINIFRLLEPNQR